MTLALWITLVAAPVPGKERTFVVDGKPLALPAAAEAAGVELRVDLLVSSEERTILATLLHRSWTPRDAAATPAHPEVPVLLGGRAPDLELEHAGARIDERLRLLTLAPAGTLARPAALGGGGGQAVRREAAAPAGAAARRDSGRGRSRAGRFLLRALAGAGHRGPATRDVGRARRAPSRGGGSRRRSAARAGAAASTRGTSSSWPTVLKPLPPFRPVTAEVIMSSALALVRVIVMPRSAPRR